VIKHPNDAGVEDLEKSRANNRELDAHRDDPGELWHITHRTARDTYAKPDRNPITDRDAHAQTDGN